MRTEIFGRPRAGIAPERVARVRFCQKNLYPLYEGHQSGSEIPLLEKFGADIPAIFRLHDVRVKHWGLPLHNWLFVRIILRDYDMQAMNKSRHKTIAVPNRPRGSQKRDYDGDWEGLEIGVRHLNMMSQLTVACLDFVFQSRSKNLRRERH